jgi:hypothetical protein
MNGARLLPLVTCGGIGGLPQDRYGTGYHRW